MINYFPQKLGRLAWGRTSGRKTMICQIHNTDPTWRSPVAKWLTDFVYNLDWRDILRLTLYSIAAPSICALSLSICCIKICKEISERRWTRSGCPVLCAQRPQTGLGVLMTWRAPVKDDWLPRCSVFVCCTQYLSMHALGLCDALPLGLLAMYWWWSSFRKFTQHQTSYHYFDNLYME